jgi:hypothetical protein
VAYKCPRCDGPVRRGASTTAGIAGGAVGGLLYAAFGSFHCEKCGPVPRSEFPPEVRTRMALGSLAMVLIALVLLIGVIVLLVVLRS